MTHTWDRARLDAHTKRRSVALHVSFTSKPLLASTCKPTVFILLRNKSDLSAKLRRAPSRHVKVGELFDVVTRPYFGRFRFVLLCYRKLQVRPVILTRHALRCTRGLAYCLIQRIPRDEHDCRLDIADHVDFWIRVGRKHKHGPARRIGI